MVMIRKCDRCREEEEVNEFVFMRSDGQGRQEVDLCVSCRNELDRFLNGELMQEEEKIKDSPAYFSWKQCLGCNSKDKAIRGMVSAVNVPSKPCAHPWHDS